MISTRGININKFMGQKAKKKEFLEWCFAEIKKGEIKMVEF